MRILIDTNILLRIADPAHTIHTVAVNATATLRKMSHELFIVPQTLYEFWAVSTRTVQANGLGMTTLEAEKLISGFCQLFRLLRDERSIFERWRVLVTAFEVRGVNSYDARLAAAMQRHGIAHLLTLNPSDFRRFDHITVIDPHGVETAKE